MTSKSLKSYPRTPDGRYFVARGKLWRNSNPKLTDKGRKALNKKLNEARGKLKRAGPDMQKQRAAKRKIHAAKLALGERGPVWWSDGAPDENNLAPRHSSYADWWDALPQEVRGAGQA